MSRYSKLARTHWPSICFFSFVLLTTFVSFSRAPTSVTVKTPTGWRVVSEAGQVFALALDKDIVWAGGKSGVYKIDRRTGTLIEHIPLGAELALVRSLAVAPDGTVWIGHMNGLTSLSGSQSRTYSDHDGLPGQRVNALLVDRNVLWVGTARGLATFENGKLSPSTLTSKLATPVVNVLFKDVSGNLWVGSTSTPNGGTTVLEGENAIILNVKSGLSHPYIQGITQDDSGTVWVATGQYNDGGVSSFVKGSKGWKVDQVLHKASGLAGEKARSLAVDHAGNLWIGSESDGLAIRHDGSTTVLSTADGLPHNEVTCIRVDQDDNVWLGTLRGVVRISKDAVAQIRGLSSSAKKVLVAR